jgi:hypothetical protein
MDLAAKILTYVALGIILLTVNLWYFRSLYQTVHGGDVVIAPIKLVGPQQSADMGETLARMLIARLKAIEWDLQHSQISLRRSDEVAKTATTPSTPSGQEAPGGMVPGIFGTPKTAGISAQLFEPASVDVKVAGVDVGGLLPRIQRWFVEDRILTFSVSFQDKSAIIAGSLDGLGDTTAKPLWIKIGQTTPEAIADEIAFALIQRKRANEGPQLGELTAEEFKSLVRSVGSVAAINRRVTTLNVPARLDFEAVLVDVGALAERMPKWSELTYFAATIAEGAENYERALGLYRRLRASEKPQVSTEVLDAKIATLERIIQKIKPEIEKSVLDILRDDERFAAGVYKNLFGFDVPLPDIAFVPNDVLNAYWDGKKINVPTVAKDIPDLTFHELAWPFVQQAWNFDYSGQSGALAASYNDVLTTLARQARLNQTADNADWMIAPGAIAWLTGKPATVLADQRPLRSMKDPGNAYKDDILGKDPQVSHFRDLVTTSFDNGGVHTNSGIGNKAFYETAIRIGSDKAGKIWVKSLSRFGRRTDLPTAAKTIYATAKELFGDGVEASAVRAGWDAVGISVEASPT